jgi:hypothetical protein
MKEDKAGGYCSLHVTDENCMLDSCSRTEKQKAL